MPTSAMQIARTGLDAQDMRIRVIAHNLANVSTTGYKRDRANFATLAYHDARVAGARSSAETAYAQGINIGTGVQVQSTSEILSQGSIKTTNQNFDLALDGEGYFEIALPGGQIGYTRAGNFTLSAERQLVTPEGYAVQPSITIPEDATSVSIATSGTVSASLPGQADAVELGQITVTSFANPAGLNEIGDNFLVATAASGAPQAGAGGEGGRGNIRQGMLEQSNVSVVEELVEMIEAQRAYEINSKMISSVDEMLRNANQTL